MRLFLASLAGPIVWALHFFAMYATQTLIAAHGGSVVTFRLIALVLTLLAIAAIGFCVLSMRPDRRPRSDVAQFLSLLAAGLAGLSVLAILWTGLAAVLLDAVR